MLWLREIYWKTTYFVLTATMKPSLNFLSSRNSFNSVVKEQFFFPRMLISEVRCSIEGFSLLRSFKQRFFSRRNKVGAKKNEEMFKALVSLPIASIWIMPQYVNYFVKYPSQQFLESILYPTIQAYGLGGRYQRISSGAINVVK